MKALIIYDHVASALKATSLLRNAGRGTNVKVKWEICVWRVSLLKFRSLAEEALAEAKEVDLIVLAGESGHTLTPRLNDWLAAWASRRDTGCAGLALMGHGISDAARSGEVAQLSAFAKRHNLDFIMDGNKLQTQGLGPTAVSF